jgi:2'-5' RNA ligase
LVPHITLGRARKDARRLTHAANNLIQPARNVFRSVTLFQSDLTPRGPVYTARSVVPLAEQI